MTTTGQPPRCTSRRAIAIAVPLKNEAAHVGPMLDAFERAAEHYGGPVTVAVCANDCVFQIFAQVDDHREYAAGGLGIGLALVRQLVALHGGSISVRSGGRNEGCTFSVSIPLKDHEGPHLRAPSAV